MKYNGLKRGLSDPTAIVSGDDVKVFFLDEEQYAPVLEAAVLTP